MKIEITRDCLCERYKHEATNYPREGLEKLKEEFKVGEVYEAEKWSNFYGTFYRIKDTLHDVSITNAKII